MIIKYTAGILALAASFTAGAQMTNFGTAYYQNQYVLNPAMSGVDAGKGYIGAAYRKSGNVKDGPNTAYLTGDYGFSERTGAGINVLYDRAGLINSVKVMGTFSYHIPLNGENRKIHLGISFGGTQSRLGQKDITGDLDDPSLYNFNNRFMQFESDFGAAYTDERLTVQATAINLVTRFKKDEPAIANRPVFFAAAAYKIGLTEDSEGASIEPKIAYRGIEGFKSIIDAGANFTFYKEMINVFGMYHTNKSISAGAGIKISNVARVSVVYTTQSSEFRTFSGGDYEIGVRFNL